MYLNHEKEETEMSIETMVLDRSQGPETGRNLCEGRARNLCHQFATFFKIGRDYDWEEQYREYREYWKNHFHGCDPE
jgi:hypothetical protein